MTATKSTHVASYKRAGQAFANATDWLSDERMSRCKILHWLGDKIDRTPSAIANAALFFLLSVLALNPSGLSPVLTNGLGFLPATYGSLKHIKKGDVGAEPLTPGGRKKDAERQYREKGKRWLDYWLVYSTSLVIESLVGEEIILAVVPFWWAIKGFAIVWFLVGLSGEIKKEVVKPKPLRLRPMSKIASRMQASSTPSPAVGPAPSGKGRHVNDGDDEESSEGATAVDPETGLSTSYRDREREGTLDNTTLRRRLVSDESIVLSATPVIPHKPRRSDNRSRSDSSSGPESEVSSPFDLSDGSASTGGSSDETDGPTSEESDSEEDSDTQSEEADSESEDSPTDSDSDIGTGTESPSSAVSEASLSDSSEAEEADDIVLPPGTPLDELALRGLKTVQTPVSPPAENPLEEAIKRAASAHPVTEAVESPTEEVYPSEAAREELVDSPSTKEQTSGTEEQTSGTEDSEARGKQDDEVHLNHTEQIPDRDSDIESHEAALFKPGSANIDEGQAIISPGVERGRGNGAEVAEPEAATEGEIVKVSLEDLLAIDQEQSAGMDDSAEAYGERQEHKVTLENKEAEAEDIPR